MRVLITGSSGRIGRVLVDKLKARHEIVGYDHKAPEDLPEGVAFHEGDLLDREALGAAMGGIEAVVHLGGIPYDRPPLHEVFQINVQGTYNALELAVERAVGIFLFASSIMAYGFGQNVDPRYFPIDEAHPVRANRPYGLSKIVGEEPCRTFTERCGIRTVCCRLTNALSDPRGGARFPQGEKHMEVAIYQYFYVLDFAAMIEKVFAATQLEHEVFLLSALDSTHSDPTAAVIAQYYPKAEVRYEHLAGHAPFVSMEKARRLLGFTPQHSWRQSSGRALWAM